MGVKGLETFHSWYDNNGCEGAQNIGDPWMKENFSYIHLLRSYHLSSTQLKLETPDQMCRFRPQPFFNLLMFIFLFMCVTGKTEPTSVCYRNLIYPKGRRCVRSIWLRCIIIVTQTNESFASGRGRVNIFGGSEVAWTSVEGNGDSRSVAVRSKVKKGLRACATPVISPKSPETATDTRDASKFYRFYM